MIESCAVMWFERKKHFIWKCADLIYNYLIWFADKLIPSSSLIWVSFSWLHSINISRSPGSQQQTHPQRGLLLLLLCAHAGTDRCADAWQMPRPFPAYMCPLFPFFRSLPPHFLPERATDVVGLTNGSFMLGTGWGHKLDPQIVARPPNLAVLSTHRGQLIRKTLVNLTPPDVRF